MPSCECCWQEAARRAFWGRELAADLYYDVMRDHEADKCVCTQKGPDGDRARAGQFWDGTVDTRLAALGGAVKRDEKGNVLA